MCAVCFYAGSSRCSQEKDARREAEASPKGDQDCLDLLTSACTYIRIACLWHTPSFVVHLSPHSIPFITRPLLLSSSSPCSKKWSGREKRQAGGSRNSRTQSGTYIRTYVHIYVRTCLLRCHVQFVRTCMYC